MNYEILTTSVNNDKEGEAIEALIKQVKSYMSLGWQPLGGPFPLIYPAYTAFGQAMIHYSDSYFDPDEYK